MNQVAQANADADFYRFDGRNYEIEETADSLQIRRRKSVKRGRQLVSLVIFCLVFGLLWAHISPITLWLGYPVSQHETLMRHLLHAAIAGLYCLGWQFLLQESNWAFQKHDGQFSFRRDWYRFVPLPPVRAVRAWRRGNGFLVALDIEGREPLAFSRLSFSRSEHAWRHDAAQVAAFLDVPLEIPPV
jgi:hypothetical protein